MKKITIPFLISCLGILTAQAQKQVPGEGIIVFGTVYQGDTIPLAFLDEVHVVGYVSPLSNAEKRKYEKLIRNVKKVYPYAKVAGKKLEEYNSILRAIQDESQKKKLMKQAEKEIEAQFSADLKKLSRAQGKILIKLIDRETGSDSYALVKELRGSFRAFFYQTFAKVFGYDLRSRYSPETDSEDRMIERIIFGIDSGTL